MARINDFLPIEPEQIDAVNDLVHIGEVNSEMTVDRRTTVAKFHQTAPNATPSTRGYVTTGAQSFGGVKTFEDGIVTSDDATINGDLNVNGDIYQNGQSYETHAEKLYTKKDMIITRDGAQSGLAQNALTGIKVEKYDGTNDGILAFDNTGTARVGDEGNEEPLLTRSEETDLRNNDLFVWDGTNHRAVPAPRPTHSNQALQSVVTDGAVTYQWGNAGSAGVAFEGTRTQYETAKLIPEGDNGYIPSGALVIITDENKTYITHGTGNAQTLSLQSSIMSAEANSGITITDNQTIKADTVIFTGTRAQWDALSSTQKAKFNIVNTTDEDASGNGVTNAVTNGDMRAVTSNAVADMLGTCVGFMIPICTTFQSTNSIVFTAYKILGNGHRDYFNALPNISGKTKKVRLLIEVNTEQGNFIDVGYLVRYGSDHITLINGLTVWGGNEPNGFSNLVTVNNVNPEVLDAYTAIDFKTSDGALSVSIASIFAQIYYE